MSSWFYLNDGWEFIETRLDKPGAVIGYSDAEWLSATVPGHIHLDLMEHGIIPNPHERMHEMGVQWVDKTDWSYRCKFEWELDEEEPNQKLVFEGLDTICTIFLNGEKIAEHDNMFVPLEVDVTGKLKAENELRIDFKSALKEGAIRMADYFKQQGLPEAVERFEERSFVRKIQCMYGWDWGPRLVSCGVWRPVKLVEYANHITYLSARQEWHEDGSVTVHAICETEGDAKPTFELRKDEEILTSETGEFHLEDPELWWPAGCGEQELYTLWATLPNHEHSKAIKIGLRQIKLLREKDDIGESFEFEVNGEKIYAKGFNWIPDHSFPSAISRARYEERLWQAYDLGSNMLRIWGGGMYESEDFYDLCDELGIMVWQDFMHACAYYPDTDEWLEVAKTEATYHLKRLRHRASLALWCGNNENLTMWQGKWNWMGHPHPPRFYGENLYDKVYADLVKELAPEHSYIHTSPCGDTEGDCNAGKVGDSHYWDAWHGRGDWKHYLDSEARFSSEYGFASSCSLALWEETLAEEDWDYKGPAVRWHDKTRKGYDTFVGYVELHYPKSESLEDWVYYSQLNQRDALRMGVEHFRRSAFCRGSLIWQLNDIWPVQSWAVIDSSGRYKAAAYELKRRLYDNDLLSLERVKDKIKIHYVNDELDHGRIRRTYWATAIHLSTGEVVRKWDNQEFQADTGFRGVVGELDLTGLSVPDTMIYVRGDGGHTWHLLGEPKEMNFAKPGRILGSNQPEHYSSRHDASVGHRFEIEVDGPVVDLMLTMDGDTAPFERNFVTFDEAGIYEIQVNQPITHFEARSLAGEHPTRMTRSPL
jgi:beta-mannosidase